MTTPEKHAPKHRQSDEQIRQQRRQRRAVRRTLAVSAIAVGATGLTVAAGVLTSPSGLAGHDVTAAGLNQVASLTAAVPAQADEATPSAVQRREATPELSRSQDRREVADPAKKAALDSSGGPAVTHTEDLAAQDPKTIAQSLLPQYGFDSSQFGCLDSLWTRESGWNPHAENASSGAYGIPQSLPGSKMGTVASDWATNPVTQIKWGLGYIRDSYGSPCGAWAHSESYGWY